MGSVSKISDIKTVNLFYTQEVDTMVSFVERGFQLVFLIAVDRENKNAYSLLQC